MQTVKIILITGYAGSGKDAAGTILQSSNYRRFAYADILKIQTAHNYGFPFELTQTQEGKASLVANKTVRQLLIEEAALMKELHNDPAYWAKLLSKAIRESKETRVVITDWRYKAELANLQNEFPEAEITTLRIYRPSVFPSSDHSEHELDNYTCTHTIANDGSLEQLREKLLLLLLQKQTPESAHQ